MPGDRGRSLSASLPVTASDISRTHPIFFIISSGVTAPGRSSNSESGPVILTIVDSSPQSLSPPSTITSALPLKSRSAYPAFVAEGLPDMFAEGAAIGSPESLISAFATGCEGTLIATLSSPPVTVAGMMSFLGMITVRGPGMKATARR